MNKTVASQSNPTPKSPVSERKAAANRANAQRSTGPRTPEGKARASLNALRHGILAKAAFNLSIEGKERRAEFDALVAGLAQEFQPRTMSEHMMVQQLAGCYWKLGKVWTHETEAAFRGWVGPTMPLEEMKEYEDFNDVNMERMIPSVGAEQDRFFPKAGLGNPTIPTGASARTVLRYQASINAMLFRCLNFLERRRRQRMPSDEPSQELDYMSELVEDAKQPERRPEERAESAAEASAHKRTQNGEADATVSSTVDAGAGKSGASDAPIEPESTLDRCKTLL